MDIEQIGVLANPGSTRMVKEIGGFRDAVGGFPGLHYRELTDIDEVAAILRDFAAAGVKLVVIVGGDGTLQAVGTSLVTDAPYEVPPMLAVLPGGRTNMAAEALGYIGKADDLLGQVVATARTGTPATVKMPFLKMQLAPGVAPTMGIFFGAATIVRGMQFCRRRIYPLGLPNALSHFLAVSYLVLVGASPFKTARSPMRRDPIAVSFSDTKNDPRAYLILLVTTLDQVLLGIKTKGPVGEGALRFTSIEYAFGAIMRSAWAFLFGRPTAKLVKGLVRRRATVVEIETDSPVTLDGEFFDPVPGEPVRLEATEPFTFLQLPDSR